MVILPGALQMDFAEGLYIASCAPHQPAFFLSQRRLRDVRKSCERYPAMAKHFRVTDVAKPVDLLQR